MKKYLLLLGLLLSLNFASFAADPADSFEAQIVLTSTSSDQTRISMSVTFKNLQDFKSFDPTNLIEGVGQANKGIYAIQMSFESSMKNIKTNSVLGTEDLNYDQLKDRLIFMKNAVIKIIN